MPPQSAHEQLSVSPIGWSKEEIYVNEIFLKTGGVVVVYWERTASLGRLWKIGPATIQKFDPYINIDPGTMSPYQHGEKPFVTDDGAGDRFLDHLGLWTFRLISILTNTPT